jgi:hypothetical protein
MEIELRVAAFPQRPLAHLGRNAGDRDKGEARLLAALDRRRAKSANLIDPHCGRAEARPLRRRAGRGDGDHNQDRDRTQNAAGSSRHGSFFSLSLARALSEQWFTSETLADDH